jgi:hypothetical protein
MESLTMLFIQSTILMGKFDVQSGRLTDPQRFQMVANPQNPKQVTMMLQSLPGNPAFIVAKDWGFYYPVKDEGMIAQYREQTTGLVTPEKSKLSLVN